MTRRRLLLFVALAVVVLAVGVWLLWPRSAITRENGEKIHVGMTLEEVEIILGGPARLETSATEASFGPERWELRNTPSHWSSDEVAIMVDFDPDNKVVNHCIGTVIHEGKLARIRRWLRL